MNLWDWLRGVLGRGTVPPPPVPAPPPAPPGEVDWAGELLARHNRARQEAGLPPLAADPLAARAARAHADWMAARRLLSHTETGDAATPGLRLTRAGYRWRAYGENIAAGYGTAEAVMAGWMASPGHRGNVLARQFAHVGFGRARADDGRWYWCAVFATPEGPGLRVRNLSGPLDSRKESDGDAAS